jgi:chaperone modulatory protein CbpM
MKTPHVVISADMAEMLDDAVLTLQEFARYTRTSTAWIEARVDAGVLAPASGEGNQQWRFSSATMVRARRIAHLEQVFDADPQLAALTTDLMEEVAELRRLLARQTGGQR